MEEWNSITKELLNLSKDDGIILHKYIFDEPYNHLDINTVDSQIYKNFNLLELKSNDNI